MEPSFIFPTDKMAHAQLLGLSTKKSNELAPLFADPHRCANPSVSDFTGRSERPNVVPGQKATSADV